MNPTDQTERPFQTRRRVLLGCDIGVAVAAAVAISALCMEYGFHDPPVAVKYLRIVQACVLAAFVTDRVLRLALAMDRREYLHENWIDFALIGVAAIAAVAFGYSQALPAAAGYVAITQVYILAALVVRTGGFHGKLVGSGVHPVWIVIGSFVVVILFGTGLLMLPEASATPAGEPISFTDALFTATSSTCVTGLIVRDTGSEFSRFGQTVILVLIQLGGLGIMIFGTVFALLAGRQLSIGETLLAGQVLSDGTIGRVGRMVGFVVVTVLVVEAVGAIAMFPMWRSVDPQAPLGVAAYRSVFHSISAFCNAGFSLQRDSLAAMRGRWQVLGVMAPLIVVGGLGFPVLYDLVGAGRRLLGRVFGRVASGGPLLTLHSKLVLVTSLVLLVVGAAVLLGVEHAGEGGQRYGARIKAADPDEIETMRKGTAVTDLRTTGDQVRAAVFQSVTARTAGFNTVEMDRLTLGGKLWMCLLMIVGGSPASTAGGMKTVTLAVILLTIWCMLRRRERVEAFHRSIADQFVRKALTVAVLYAGLLVVVTLLLTIASAETRMRSTEMPPTFMQVFFEAVSACGTVGLTCGLTESLTAFGKYVIIAAMFIGRLGPLTLLLALTVRIRPAKYAYPSEEVVLG